MAVENNIAVRCHDIVKEFRSGDASVRVLHDVELEIPSGAITMLVGPSGCGKTTLISIIAGILTPTSGRVEVLGEDLFSLADRRRVAFRRQHIGFIFQQYNLLPALDAADNAAVPLIAAGVEHRVARRRAIELLDELGMRGHTHKKPTELSGGQQQRVAVARALVHEPRLVICDEPTAALDAQTGQAVLELLRRIAVRPGRAVVVVTHDNRIFPFADRIAHMDDGRVSRVDELAEATIDSHGPGSNEAADARRAARQEVVVRC